MPFLSRWLAFPGWPALLRGNAFFLIWTTLLLAISPARAQPTVNMYQRVFMIEYMGERGTVFSIDVDGREYWITAKHILTGAKSKPYGSFPADSVAVKLLAQGADTMRWVSHEFTVLQPAEDVDVVVLVPKSILLRNALPSPEATSKGLVLGGECQFLGFAYGGGWRMNFRGTRFWAPYIKRCGVSGMDGDTHLWVLDGINNAGFSGGPVLHGTGATQKVAAVISGYRTEPTEVIHGNSSPPAGQPADKVNLNSGFILSYDISIATDLIKKNPIGPARDEK